MLAQWRLLHLSRRSNSQPHTSLHSVRLSWNSPWHELPNIPHFLLPHRDSSPLHTLRPQISTLVVAQPKGHQVGPEALSAVTAAKSLGGGITVLLAGHDLAAASKHASRIQGVSQVI